MRTLMASYWLPPHYSGAGSQALRLAHALSQADVDVTIVTGRHGGRDELRQEKVEGVAVVRTPLGRWRRLFALRFALGAAWTLWHRRRQTDVVHLHGMFWRSVPVWWMAFVLGKPIVVKLTQAGADDPQAVRGRRFGRLLAWMVAHTAAVVAISDDLARRCEAGGVNRPQLQRIPNGVDMARFRADKAAGSTLRRRLGVADSDLLALFVGKVWPAKGIDVLMDAWPSVLQAQPHLHLILIGQQSNMLFQGRPFSQVAAEWAAKWDGRVHIFEPTAEIVPFYQAADLFVFPSRGEGMPNAVLEAMALGLPVVASAIGGVTDLVSDGKTGLLVPAGDAAALAVAVQAVAADEGLRDRLGRGANLMVAATYSQKIVANQYRVLYQNMLTERNRK